MKFKNENDLLTLYFEGELNSYNAASVEEDIENILKTNSFKELVLDFNSLIYISSAGLRIILKLKQRFNNTFIDGASLEVYDILSMTGFTNIMTVKKALKKIDITDAKVIGEGFFSTVYRLDKDTIIKVFNRVSDPDQIERELRLAKQAFILGIPTAISFDIVRVDDKLGVRFEMLDCNSLKNTFASEDANYEELVDKYAKLLKLINTTESLDENLPSIKDFYLEKLEFVKDDLVDAYSKLKKMIEDLPLRTTFVHGDCHFKNIMVQGGDFLLIDMDTLSYGNPIFELAAIRATYIAFEEDSPGNCERFLGLNGEFCKKLYDDVLKAYLANYSEENLDKIAILCYLHMMWWTKVNDPSNELRYQNSKARLLKLLPNYDDLDIGE